MTGGLGCLQEMFFFQKEIPPCRDGAAFSPEGDTLQETAHISDRSNDTDALPVSTCRSGESGAILRKRLPFIE